ncbi:tRNA (adenosine(37)-N6)-threonylcarbamoyltransferase complex transferase subunit TsaD [Emcibacter sp.]|uniref:tRNA (adenosine(37)-N6)-threonylcarbamoyltransferase complex transferase subunit TsaD n=1 Tax=Emcibacter sp. TaxID=1979954 RepID=UPI002AA61F87|nr:tRNA (adenosine(37)-N6)-threonylcarbamoyltransferase complex transferase subunit TsaD [Emcibacter sp.]
MAINNPENSDQKTPPASPLVLGLETSCDETAAAVVDGKGRILSNVVMSQLDEHRPYGGVVPEIAARSHIDHLDDIITEALQMAGIEFSELDAVAATSGPGLIGGVMVGLMTGKAIASACDIPFMGINHLEGHALSVRLNDAVAFPYLLLLVSGGHCQLQVVRGVGRYERLGTTIDDAAGEAFDKTAKLLGLDYPGGPAVEKAALKGTAGRFSLPRPLKGRPDCNFSFSGLKTAVRREVEKLGQEITQQDVYDLAADFQLALTEAIIDRVGRALDIYLEQYQAEQHILVVAGGVAANTYLRKGLEAACGQRGVSLVAPPPALCTDNGAMIAWAGVERLRLGQVDDLSVGAKARWPLDPDAPAVIGAGVKA